MSKSGFCWADEVEKEEEEQSQIHLRQHEKPNPFGSARPREVVLQEKGIDWRKFDEKLHHQPSIPRKEKALEPVESLNIQNQDGDSVVPPLRYPPRNIMSLLKANMWPELLNELGIQKPLKPNYRDFEWEKENSVLGKGGRFVGKELGGMRKLRSSSVQREREWGDMDFECKERRRRSPSVGVLPNAERMGYHHVYKEDRYREYSRPLEECGNMEYMYGRQRLDPRKIEDPYSGRVDGRKAQAWQDVSVGGGFGINKRRGIELGPNNNHTHQRRGR